MCSNEVIKNIERERERELDTAGKQANHDTSTARQSHDVGISLTGLPKIRSDGVEEIRADEIKSRCLNGRRNYDDIIL